MRYKKVPVNVVEMCARQIVSLKAKEYDAYANLEERLEKGVRADISGLLADIQEDKRVDVMTRVEVLLEQLKESRQEKLRKADGKAIDGSDDSDDTIPAI
jgi:hypothetical protein